MPVFSQEKAASQDFWLSPSAETAFFSLSANAYGGGLAFAYGTGASIGFKAVFFQNTEDHFSTLELCFLLRYNVMGGVSGFFFQLMSGPVLFFTDRAEFAIPSEWGTVSIGISAGWRFLLGRTLFVEPSVRGGYPYIFGAGLSAGFHF